MYSLRREKKAEHSHCLAHNFTSIKYSSLCLEIAPARDRANFLFSYVLSWFLCLVTVAKAPARGLLLAGCALNVSAVGASDVGGELLALALVLGNVKLDVLALGEGTEALSIDGSLVHKHVLAPAIGRNKPKALGHVEELDLARLLHLESGA